MKTQSTSIAKSAKAPAIKANKIPKAAKAPVIPHLETPVAATIGKNVFTNLVATVEKAAVEVIADDAVAKVKTARIAREERNGIKKPLKGVCADVWAYAATLENPTTAQMQAHGETVGWNKTNVQIEFYGYRKFHGLAKQSGKATK